MAVTIGTQPVDSRQAIEFAHEFVVSAVGTDGPLRYQWYVGVLLWREQRSGCSGRWRQRLTPVRT